MSLVESAIVTKAFSEFADLVRKSIDKNSEKLEQTLKVRVVQEPDAFSYSCIRRATTTNTSKPLDSNPDLEFQLPIDIDATVSEFSIIPNTAFNTKGMIQVTIDDVTYYENLTVADFTDVFDSHIKSIEGKTIKRRQKVKVFIWSPDGTSVSLTAQVSFGE